MPKVLVVFGGTGKQGGSVVEHVINDPELSQKYNVRCITRDVDSDKAKQLREKVEVVQGDVNDRESLERALTGANTVFAMTTFDFSPNAREVEFGHAKAIADVAVEKGVEYIIFSTLPGISDISGGKYTRVFPFDAKAKAEQYIRGLPIRSAFFAPGAFMDNITPHSLFAPKLGSDGSWAISLSASPQMQLPMINAAGDSGKFVGAILAEPDKYEGNTLRAATALYSMDQIAASLSKMSGKTVVYKQDPSGAALSNFPPMAADLFTDYFAYGSEFGYFGPGTEESVASAASHARGKLSTLDEYLQAHPFKLE